MYKLFGSGLVELNEEKEALGLGANIHIVKGDLIAYTDYMYRCDFAIMHQVNCKGVMGAGLAKQIASRYPDALREYKTYCNKNGSKALGTALGVRAPGGKFVINLFGQDEYSRTKQCTDYKALESALAQARLFMLKNHIDYAAIPYGLGCGLGGGDWNIVLGLIRKAFDKKCAFNNGKKIIQIYIFKMEETIMEAKKPVNITKEAAIMQKPILKKENKTMLKKPLIIAATNSAFRQDFGKNEIMKIAKACCPEDHMLYTFTTTKENNKVIALSLINIFNNKVLPAHKDVWDPALYSEFIDNDGVVYPYGTMDAQTKMEYVYAYIKRTFGSLDALVFTTPYDDDRSLVNTFDKVSVFVRAEGFTYNPAVYQATGDPIIENGKQAVWYKYTETVEERYVKVSAKRYMQFDFEKLPFSLPARSLKPDYNASYINDSDNYWSDEYDCMIEKGNKYNDAYALQHAFRFKADADMTKDLESYELFKQVFDCHNYKVRRDRYDTYTMDPRVSKEDIAQEIEYMKAVQKFIAETGHTELFLKDRNCPVCNKHFVGDVCPRCKHKYDESAPEREIAIGSIKIMDMIGRNDDGDIVVGTEAADGSDWVEDDLDTDF